MEFLEMPRFIDIASGYPLELQPQRMTFGTAADNSVPIAEGFDLCARHFQVTPVPGGNLLVDMSGQQATLLNDEPVSQAMLRNGDVVTAGRMKLRYESQVVPPPLPPEPPPAVMEAPMPPAPVYGQSIRSNEVAPRSEPPPPQENRVLAAIKTGRKIVDIANGRRTSLPSGENSGNLLKWGLPILGLIIGLAKWGHKHFGSNKEEAIGTAYALIDTYRDAHEAKAPLIENVNDARRIVRLLVKGVYGGGSESGHEFKAFVDEDEAEDALEVLMWREGEGLTFKNEYREYRTNPGEEE